MRRLIWIPFLALPLLLGGCASWGSDKEDDGFNLRVVVLKDVQQARIMAEGVGDVLGAKCWIYLEGVAEETDAPKGEVVGVLSAYQKARNVRRVISRIRNSDQLKLECGPMRIDTLQAIKRAGRRLILF